MMVLGTTEVQFLAALPPTLPPQMAPVAELLAARQAEALAAVGAAVAEHWWLPTLRHVDVTTGGDPIRAEAHVGPGDVQAVAAWAAAYGQPVELSRSSDPEAPRVHASALLLLVVGTAGPAVALRVWTVVRTPTGDPAVDRLLEAAEGERDPAAPVDAYTEAWPS